MNHSIFSDCKGSAFFKCGHLFSAEVIPVLFTDFRIFDFSKIGCGSEVELKNKFSFVLLSPFAIFAALNRNLWYRLTT